MTTALLAPDPIQGTWLVPGGNTPANGGQLFFYQNKTTTKQTVYKDSAAGTAWSNPIVLDSGGNLPNGAQVYFPTGQTFTCVFAPSTDTDPPNSPFRTLNDLAGVNDVSTSVSDWVTGPTPTFVGSTQFTLSGDQTNTFTKSRRLKFTVTAGTVYGSISGASYSGGPNQTTVNVAFSSGALDAGLSAVWYSLIDPNIPTVNADYTNKQASSVASAGSGTTNVWGSDGNSLHITGTNNIFSLSTAPYIGAMRDIVMDSALVLFSSASFILPGSTNITTAAGDTWKAYAEAATTTRVFGYQKASGFPITQSNVSTIVFSANGTYTKGANVRKVKATVIASGGGGGGCSSSAGSVAGGGGAGATCIGWFDASQVAATTAVNVSTGGSGGGASANGGAGASASLGGLIVCTGGQGGSAGLSGTDAAPGSGGTVTTTSTYNFNAAAGTWGLTARNIGGYGAASWASGGGQGGAGAGGGVGPGPGSGGGGAGSSGIAQGGGNGGPGLVVIEEYS